MADYNALYTTRIDQDINVVIEIPEGSHLKVEYNRTYSTFELDRVEPMIFSKPVNYGFIPKTLDEDGDELDALVVCSEPIPMGVVVRAKVIGIMNFEDGGEMDHKVVCVVSDDRTYGNSINSLDDLGEQWQKMIEHHFSHYKDLKKGGTKVLGWGNIDEANQTIEDCMVAFKSQA